MKKLLAAAILVLGACDDGGCETDCPDDTGVTDGTDDTDTGETDTEPVAPAITMASDRIVLAQGDSTSLAFSVDDGGATVELTSDATPEGCVSLDQGEASLGITASSDYLGDCRVRLVATNSAGVGLIEVPIVVDTDWGGTIVQWGTLDSEYPVDAWVDAQGTVHLSTIFGANTEPALLSVTVSGEVEGPVYLGGTLTSASELTGIDDTVYVGASESNGNAYLVPVRGGKAGTPFPLDAAGDHAPVAAGVAGDQVWMATSTDDSGGTGGLAVGGYSLDGSTQTASDWFPSTERGINLYGAVNYGPDLLAWGLPYDAEGIFPGQSGEDPWGSFVAHLKPDGTPVNAFGVGTGNVQIADVAVVDGLAMVIGGRVTNDGLLDGNGPGSGRDEPFVQLLESDGSKVWTRYWTTEDDVRVRRVLVDGDRVFVLMLERVEGGFISNMAVLDLSDGSILWQDTLGTTSAVPWSAARHGDAVVIAGATFESLGGENQGKADVFVARIGWDGSAR